MHSASSDPGGGSDSETGRASGGTEAGGAGDDSGLSTGGVVALGIALVLVLGTANVLLAVDRTALDSDYAIETIGEEDVYASITSDVQESAAEAINDSIDDDAREEMTDEQRERIHEIPREEIREEYVESEMTRTIEALYAYIHGDRSAVTLSMNLTEPREGIIQAIEDDPDLGPLVDTDEVRASIPDEQNVTRGGEVPGEVDTIQAGAGEVTLLSWLLPLLSLGLVGVIYYLTRSAHRTANAAGAAFLIVGGIGLIVGYGLRSLGTSAAASAFHPNGVGPASYLADGFVAVVDGMFDAIVMQSVVFVIAGVSVVGLVWVDKRGYFDRIKAPLRGGDEADSDDATGEYSQQGGSQQPSPEPQQQQQQRQRQSSHHSEQQSHHSAQQSRHSSKQSRHAGQSEERIEQQEDEGDSQQQEEGDDERQYDDYDERQYDDYDERQYDEQQYDELGYERQHDDEDDV